MLRTLATSVMRTIFTEVYEGDLRQSPEQAVSRSSLSGRPDRSEYSREYYTGGSKKDCRRGAGHLVPQLQRQTLSRLLSPTGNDLPDLGNLAARFGRSQKEQLAGVLTPEQIQNVDNLGRISRIVKYEANPSGSGKLVQRTAEGGALISGALKAVGGILTGNPLAVAEGAAPFAWSGGTRIAASKLTDPAFTEAIMNSRLIKPLPGETMADYLARKRAR